MNRIAIARNGTLILLFAAAWMMLQESYGLSGFVGGALVGGFVLLTFPTPVHGLINPRMDRRGGLFRWLYYATYLFLYFNWQLLLGNVSMAVRVLTPRMNLTPGVLKFPLRVRQAGQIALLANLITLTPGSFTMEVSDDYDVLYLHVVDASDPEAVLGPIRRQEELIMEVLR